MSARTEAHERHLCSRHLAEIAERRVQGITRRELGRILKGMKENYSPWTATAVLRLMVGVFALAVRDDIITRSPADRISPAERPRQKNARDIERLDTSTMNLLITAGSTERWRAALALAGLGGLRIGEVRGIKWEDIEFEANALYVRRSLLPSGEAKGTKSDAGRRTDALYFRTSVVCFSRGRSSHLGPVRTTTSSAPTTEVTSPSGISGVHLT